MTKMLKRATAGFMVLGLPAMVFAAGEGWTDNVDQAMATAQSEQKDLLMDFTGSDWCGWCIRLNNEVFSQDEFKSKAPESFVLVELDFPQSKPQTDELKRQNAQWRDKFGVRGYPTIMLTDAKGVPYAQTGYRQGGAEAYVKHLEELRAKRVARDEAFAKAEKASGLEKAKLLDQGLSALEPNVLRFYEAEVNAIMELDAKNEAGLKDKYQAVIDAKEAAKREAELRAFLQPLQRMINAGDHAGALKRVDEAIEKFKPTNEMLLNLQMAKVQINMAAGNATAALAEVDKAIEIAPENVKGQLQQVRQRIEQASAQQ